LKAPVIATKLQTARIRDHVGLSERRRIRKTAIMDLQIRIQTKVPSDFELSKRYQPLWLLTMLSSRQNQIDDVHYHEAPVETKDMEWHVPLPRSTPGDERWGG